MKDKQIIGTSQRDILYKRLESKLEIAYNLNRRIVSFQANKTEPIYRWFKYKEGFSSSLVKFFLNEFYKKPGVLLDPFAGAGTSLFAGQDLGWSACGIELLPVGVLVMKTREALIGVNIDELKKHVDSLWSNVEKQKSIDVHIHHISITKDAFPQETEILLNKYLSYCNKVQDYQIKMVLQFAAFSVLEEISYTRKDGQYLRWDYRSSRSLSGVPFNKGKILPLKEAIDQKLMQILTDLSGNVGRTLFDQIPNVPKSNSTLNIISGSCLEKLPKLKKGSIDFVITSPPYCNRYDYTRTYALELVFLGQTNDDVRSLRQAMLSCTVENKEKIEQLKAFYTSIKKQSSFDFVIKTYNSSGAMAEVNAVLDELNSQNKLNNKNIPRMVKNYFLEMCFVIFELSRVLKTGGVCIMVNDNVRYGGEEIPVDLILSDFAFMFGFSINKIFVLPKGKGNSSQQMGSYGRTEVRKCVYYWQKI